MSNDEARGPGDEVTGVTEGDILGDIESRYADLRCPVHNTPPRFEIDTANGTTEHFCCETLAQIFRELRAGEAGQP